MPYADPEKRKAAKRKSFNKRYANDSAFRESEAARKAEWLATEEGATSNRESSLAYWHRSKAQAAK